MTEKKLAQKRKYVSGYIGHLENQIKEYGKNTAGLKEKAEKQIKAFKNCFNSSSCAGCMMSKTCGYANQR